MTFTLTPVTVAVDGVEGGRLVFLNQRLVAVLTCLGDQYGADAGRWFLEAGFGWLDGPDHPTFTDLPEAQSWIAGRLIRGPDETDHRFDNTQSVAADAVTGRENRQPSR